MPSHAAALLYILLILGLFWLDREKGKTSPALWVPIAWLAIVCSRPISVWLDEGGFRSASEVHEGSPIDRAVYAILTLVGIAIVAGRTKRAGRLISSNWALTLFMGYSLLSLSWSDYPDVALKRLIKALGDIVMILVVFTDQQPLSAAKRVLTRTGYVLIPLSLLLIKYYPAVGRGYGEWLGEVMYTGITTNKNTLGTISMCLGLGALWRLISDFKDKGKPRRHMIASLVMLSIVGWLLNLTDSKTSLGTFLMASVVLLVSTTRIIARRPILIHLLVASMVVSTALVLFVGMSPELLRSIGRNPSLTDRTLVWENLLRLVENPLVGTGFETFWLGPRLATMWQLYWWRPNQAHNGYIEIYINLGVVGIGLLAIFLAVEYRNACRNVSKGLPMASLCLAYIFSGVVFNFTEAAFFRMQAPQWLFFLFAVVGGRALGRQRRFVRRGRVAQVGTAVPTPFFRPKGLSL